MSNFRTNMQIVRSTSAVIFMLVLLPQPSASLIGGFFIRDPSKCQLRCDSKHGFWETSLGHLERVSDGWILARFKCCCELTSRLRKLVLQRFGKGTTRRFRFHVFRGYSRPIRYELMRTDRGPTIQFVSHAQRGLYQQYVKEKQARDVRLPPGVVPDVEMHCEFLKDDILKWEAPA